MLSNKKPFLAKKRKGFLFYAESILLTLLNILNKQH